MAAHACKIGPQYSQLCDVVILVTRPWAQVRPPHTRTHTVAAINAPLRSAQPQWFILHWCRTGIVYPLQVQDVVFAFDAEVCYGVLSEGQVCCPGPTSAADARQ